LALSLNASDEGADGSFALSTDKMPQDTSTLASTLIARIFGYHFSLFDEFWFIDVTRKRPFGNDFYFKILGFVLSRFFLWF